jgi:hypothetical protein
MAAPHINGVLAVADIAACSPSPDRPPLIAARSSAGQHLIAEPPGDAGAAPAPVAPGVRIATVAMMQNRRMRAATKRGEPT